MSLPSFSRPQNARIDKVLGAYCPRNPSQHSTRLTGTIFNVNMSSTQNYVTRSQLLSTSYAMIALTSAFVLARIAVQFLRPKKLAPEDYLIYLAYIFYLAMSVLYIVVTPPMYRISDFTSGKSPMYPQLLDDSMLIIKVFFANTTIFWCVLWTVKFSLLALYKRLFVGLHSVYIKIWWGVVCFCVLVCQPNMERSCFFLAD